MRRFSELHIFSVDPNETIRGQLETMQETKQDEVDRQAPMKPRLGITQQLEAAVKVELANGAGTVSESLRRIAKHSPHLIENACSYETRANNVPAQSANATSEFWRLVGQTATLQSCGRSEAIRIVASKNPELHQRYIDEVNNRSSQPQGAKVGPVAKQYFAKVREIQAAENCSRGEAMSRLNKREPMLRERLVNEVNS